MIRIRTPGVSAGGPDPVFSIIDENFRALAEPPQASRVLSTRLAESVRHKSERAW